MPIYTRSFWLGLSLIFSLVHISTARASTPVFQLCQKPENCTQTKQMVLHKQKVLDWSLKVPHKALRIGQECIFQVPKTVSATMLDGRSLPKIKCPSNTTMHCLGIQVGQMLLLTRVQLPKGPKISQIWIVKSQKNQLPKALAQKFGHKYKNWRWNEAFQETRSSQISLKKDLLSSLLSSHKPSTKSNTQQTQVVSSTGSSIASAFLADFASVAKSKATERVMERLKERLCKRLCACGRKGKKSILPKTCQGLLKNSMNKIIRNPENIRNWLRQDLFGFLKTKTALRFSKQPKNPIRKILLNHLFQLIEAQFSGKASYSLRKQLQDSVSQMLTNILKELKLAPQLELVLRISIAKLQQCLETGGSCSFDLSNMLNARKNMKSELKKVRNTAWKRWQGYAETLKKRFQLERQLLQKMGQRCLASSRIQFTLPFPNGRSQQVNCSNHAVIAVQFRQSLDKMMPNFSSFLKGQPEFLFLQKLRKKNQPFFQMLENLFLKMKKARGKGKMTAKQLRTWLLREMVDVQWFLSHLHGMLVDKKYSNKERIQLFLSLAMDIGKRMLKAKQESFRGQQKQQIEQVKQAIQRLKTFQKMAKNLLAGHLSEALRLAASSLIQSKKRQAKAFQFLVMLVSLADGSRNGSSQASAQRKQIIEKLFEQANNRKNRTEEWLLSLGLGIGLTTGYQWLAKNQEDGYTGEFAAPQLALPTGFALEYWGNDKFGFHAFVFALDIGQFTSYELGKNTTQGSSKANKPSIGSLFALGLHLGIVWGTPANPFVLGIEARYSPTLFEGVDGKRTGAARFGLFLGTHFHFTDFF